MSSRRLPNASYSALFDAVDREVVRRLGVDAIASMLASIATPAASYRRPSRSTIASSPRPVPFPRTCSRRRRSRRSGSSCKCRPSASLHAVLCVGCPSDVLACFRGALRNWSSSPAARRALGAGRCHSSTATALHRSDARCGCGSRPGSLRGHGPLGRDVAGGDRWASLGRRGGARPDQSVAEGWTLRQQALLSSDSCA